MENRFNNRDFEQFVKQSADQYRMFPSEKVWNGIHNTLHTRRRWYGIGLALLLLTTATVTWIMFINPSGKQEQLAFTPITATTKEFIEQKAEIPDIVIAPAKSNRNRPAFVASPGNQQENLFLADATAPVIPSDDVYASAAIEVNAEASPLPEPVTAAAISSDPVATTKTAVVSTKTTAPVVANKTGRRITTASAVKPIVAEDRSTSSLPVFFADSDINNKPQEAEKPAANADEKAFTLNKDIYPLTIESVTNSYVRLARKKRLSWEIYFLPTISYRKLTENKDFLLKSQPTNAPANGAIADDINNVVTHKPDIGLEAGFNIGFPVSKNIKFTTGLQLNVSKYDIKAYPYQREEARIAFSNAYGRTSAVSNIETTYRAQESYTKPHWLSNYYVSASLPIGAELKIGRLKNNNGYIGVGSTIQPTYTIIDRAYIISTDFKNYAKLPSLTRNWNLNSSFEIFAAYSTKNIDWKIGPQVRYQLLSSFDKKYPVKEHLMNFGLKVAVVLNK